MVNAFDQLSPPSSFPAGTGTSRVQSDQVWGYAGFWWRVLAWMIDSVILSFVTLLIERVIGGSLFSAIGVPPAASGSLFNISYIPAETVQLSQYWHPPVLAWPTCSACCFR